MNEFANTAHTQVTSAGQRESSVTATKVMPKPAPSTSTVCPTSSTKSWPTRTAGTRPAADTPPPASTMQANAARIRLCITRVYIDPAPVVAGDNPEVTRRHSHAADRRIRRV